jgi:hypothetical protein
MAAHVHSINGLRLAFTLRAAGEYLYWRRMIRIETSVRRGRVVFAVIGRIEGDDLPELKRLIESHNVPASLDLKGVRLVDRDVVTFLANFETDKGKITNCPTYIREWIRRERAEG